MELLHVLILFIWWTGFLVGLLVMDDFRPADIKVIAALVFWPLVAVAGLLGNNTLLCKSSPAAEYVIIITVKYSIMPAPARFNKSLRSFDCSRAKALDSLSLISFVSFEVVAP